MKKNRTGGDDTLDGAEKLCLLKVWMAVQEKRLGILHHDPVKDSRVWCRDGSRACCAGTEERNGKIVLGDKLHREKTMIDR